MGRVTVIVRCGSALDPPKKTKKSSRSTTENNSQEQAVWLGFGLAWGLEKGERYSSRASRGSPEIAWRWGSIENHIAGSSRIDGERELFTSTERSGDFVILVNTYNRYLG